MSKFLLLLLLVGCSHVTSHKKLVLVIGDSISLGYTPYLQKELGSGYEVLHPSDNCRNSRYTLENIDLWISRLPRKPDIVIWNNGIWNTIHDYTEEPIERLGTTVEQYKDDMSAIAAKLQLTSAKLYFNTTTHIAANNTIFNAGYEDLLNASIIGMLSYNNVITIDLNAKSSTLESYKKDPVHYTEEGYEKLAKFIAETIKQQGDK